VYWTLGELVKELDLDLDLISAHASEEKVCCLETLKPTSIIFKTAGNETRKGKRKNAPNQLIKL
jgi:hypothetical protein